MNMSTNAHGGVNLWTTRNIMMAAPKGSVNIVNDLTASFSSLKEPTPKGNNYGTARTGVITRATNKPMMMANATANKEAVYLP